jgi:DNA-binding transcriptional ArsR family regulator
VNAAFLAISDPRARRILELLRIAPMTERELQEHVDLGHFEGSATLDDLVASRLITAVRHDQGMYFSLNRKGLTHVSAWLKAFDL